MARDEYFSFGEEELDEAAAEGGSPALALLDRPDDPAEEPAGAAEMRAGSPRGDSDSGSSERARPSSGRTRTLVLCGLALLVSMVGWIALSALSGPRTTGRRDAEPSAAAGQRASAAAALRASRTAAAHARREHARERELARRRRAKTRRRARRHRQRRRAAYRREAEKRREAAAPAQPEAPASQTYVPLPEPAPEESAPSPQAAPAQPPAHGGYADGAHSSEFGL